MAIENRDVLERINENLRRIASVMERMEPYMKAALNDIDRCTYSSLRDGTSFRVSCDAETRRI